MKKLALLVSMVAAVAAVGVGVASATDPPRMVAEETGFVCGVFNADGSIALTTDSRATLLYNGKEILHCIGQATGTGTVVNFKGFLCGMVFTGLSSDTEQQGQGHQVRLLAALVLRPGRTCCRGAGTSRSNRLVGTASA